MGVNERVLGHCIYGGQLGIPAGAAEGVDVGTDLVGNDEGVEVSVAPQGLSSLLSWPHLIALYTTINPATTSPPQTGALKVCKRVFKKEPSE